MSAVELTSEEWAIAKFIGGRRHDEALKRGYRDQHGMDKDPLLCHIEGVCGEIACASVLNVYFHPSVNTFKKPDIPPDIQVRARSHDDYDLIFRQNDDPRYVWVLVTGRERNYTVRGWFPGVKCQQPKYLKTHGGREPAWFIPQTDLYPISLLIERTHGRLLCQAMRFGAEPS